MLHIKAGGLGERRVAKGVEKGATPIPYTEYRGLLVKLTAAILTNRLHKNTVQKWVANLNRPAVYQQSKLILIPGIHEWVTALS